MYKITFLTLFPELFQEFLKTSIIKRAILDEKVEINIHNIRDYSLDPHKKVDDYQFGGGPGMVIGLQAICDCLDSIKTSTSKVVLLTPTGKQYSHQLAKKLLKTNHLILICMKILSLYHLPKPLHFLSSFELKNEIYFHL